jgi:hypothetical protein
MSREINFLNERRKKLTKQESGDRNIMMMTGYFVAIIFIISCVAFGVSFYFDRQVFDLQEAQKVARSQITTNQNVEKSFVIFVHKLSSLANIYQDKQDKKAVIQFFSSAFDPSISIQEISFNQPEKLLTFHLQSEDIFAMQKVFSLFNSPDFRVKFQSVNLSNLSRSSDGRYIVVITVSTNKPKL